MGNDLVFGEGGNDDIGLGYDNALEGGLTDNDECWGGTGADTINGAQGDDYLYGEEGDDGLYGGNGEDFLSGGDNNDALRGGAGNDRLYGGEGDDTLNGDANDDYVLGGFGADTVRGGTGADGFERHAPDNYPDFNRQEGDFWWDALTANQAPMGNNNAVTTLENQPYTFALNNFGFADGEDSPYDNFLAVKITELPNTGALKLGEDSIGAGDLINVGDIEAERLRWTPPANTNGEALAILSFQVQDDGGTANDGANLDPTARTMTINVLFVNQAPTAADNTVNTTINTSYYFQAADFGFSDVDGNGFQALIITSLSTNGVLLLNGDEVFANQVITVANVQYLSYRPPTDQGGIAFDSFTFNVQDDGGTDNGGIDTSELANTITINVNNFGGD